MLIRTSIDGPLFYEFIFNLSFVPRLVCPSGFMLSPLGSEVMISCHVVFFRVICYNPALQIKMTTTAPPGHVHEDFLTVIDKVKPAPVNKRKLVLLHYIGRLIGTRQQWVRAVAMDNRVNVAPSHLPRWRGSGWICDQR